MELETFPVFELRRISGLASTGILRGARPAEAEPPNLLILNLLTWNNRRIFWAMEGAAALGWEFVLFNAV